MKLHPMLVLAAIIAALSVSAAAVWPSCAKEAAGDLTATENGMDNNWSTTTASAPRIDTEQPQKFETATFAVGWFWTPDSRFGSLPGIIRTRVGYTGGSKASPTYYSLGDHTESFQVDYDPSQITYDELLELFWVSHNPHNRPFSQQYKPVVFYNSEEQRQLAEASKAKLASESGKPVYTEILPLNTFYRAEDYHQKYYLRHQKDLMAELTAMLGSDQAFTDSTLTARLNSYVAQHGFSSVLMKELDSYDLSDAADSLLTELSGHLDEGAWGGPTCGVPL